MVNIQTQYAGLSLQSPIIIGSSGLTNNAERNKAFEKAGAGAIVLKSLFEEQMEMQGDAMLYEADARFLSSQVSIATGLIPGLSLLPACKKRVRMR